VQQSLPLPCRGEFPVLWGEYLREPWARPVAALNSSYMLRLKRPAGSRRGYPLSTGKTPIAKQIRHSVLPLYKMHQLGRSKLESELALLIGDGHVRPHFVFSNLMLTLSTLIFSITRRARTIET
jgi:hypothetical protein